MLEILLIWHEFRKKIILKMRYNIAQAEEANPFPPGKSIPRNRIIHVQPGNSIPKKGLVGGIHWRLHRHRYGMIHSRHISINFLKFTL